MKKFKSIFQIGIENKENRLFNFLNSRKDTNEFYKLKTEDLIKYKEYLDSESKFIEQILNKK